MATATIGRMLPDLQAYRRGARRASTPIEYVGNPSELDLGLVDVAYARPAEDDAPLLGRETEVALFRQMNALKWKAECLRDGLDPQAPCPETLGEIEALLGEADEIRSWITRANRRLVKSISRKFVTPAHDHQELIAEGHLPLLRAVELFDVSRGFRFSTYASWAVTKHLTRYLQRERQRSDRFQTGRDEAVEVVADHRSEEFDEGLMRRARTSLRGLIDRLDAREQRVLAARFGLGGADLQTLAQLGAQLGVTKERVRQIEIAAQAKLRRLARAEKLDALVS